MKIVFDIETTAIPDTGIKDIEAIHCCVARDIESDTEWVADASTGYTEMLKILSDADVLIGHNIISFDIPILRQFFPKFNPKGKSFDTLVMARALWHDVIVKDFGRVKAGRLPPRLKGSHKLEAYGYRLGELKGDYGMQSNAWDIYTQEMLTYCQQDVVVTKKLYLKQLSVKPSQKMINLENEFAQNIKEQEDRGVCFDEKSAVELMAELRDAKLSLVKELQEIFPPRYIPLKNGKVFVSKVNSPKRHITKGAKFCKIKLEEFNPGSRNQIASRLINTYGWEPEQRTDAGAVQINELILEGLDYPEAKVLNQYLMINKRLSQIADGNQAWLKKVKGGRIYGRVNTGGAISGRCTHSSPNLAQVPSINSPYGKECRSFFKVPERYKMVGCDASGLELRCLAHYLFSFDDGKYADIVLNGDIHTANQQAAGLPERDMAKTFIYGWLYGAGAIKLGKIVGGGAREGGKLKAKFLKAFPAVAELKAAVSKAVQTRAHLIGLDGRRMRTRSDHSALNLLLQGSGALVMKQWLNLVMAEVKARGLDATPVLNVHDEGQFEVREDQAEEFAKLCEDMMPLAGEHFNFKIPITGESKIGDTWRDTH